MQAYGSDRLRMKGERAILLCTMPKPNWVPRVPKTLTTSEHPGTAVMWDEELWEVVEAAQVGNSVRYELEKWREEHIMRGSDVYDDASESHRAEEHRKQVARTRKRFAVNLTGVFAGYLPAAVQNELASELGVLANRMTFLSGIVSLAGGAAFAFITVTAKLAQRGESIPGEVMDTVAGSGHVPLWPIAVAIYLCFESIIRFFFVMAQNRPIGSPLGFIAYTIYWLLSPKRAQLVSPFEVPKGERLFTMPPPEYVALGDKLEMSSPFLTLLTPDEQRRLQTTVGFDYRVYATKVAVFVLVFSLIGVASSVWRLQGEPKVSTFVSLVVAIGLAGEQLLRLASFRNGPSGSILGIVVRPFVRGLLEHR